MKFGKHYNYYESVKLNESELSTEIATEISVLKGLDVFTNAHVLGVVKKTSAMCRKMKYSYDDTKKCIIAAYLHDIGKIKIPPEILQKNSKLTNEEYEIMKKHTVYGYEICMEYEKFKKLAPIVRAHHENLDGTGYPDGLKESEIPEEAKLLKVSDVYDALTQKRQYKSGFKPSEALGLMLNDVKAGKMSREYFEIMTLVVLDDLKESLDAHVNNVNKYQNNIMLLRELENIYKQIYDKGLTKSLQKRLDRFELEPGYDMTTNMNILALKQKSLEREMAFENDTIKEISDINIILKKLYKM